MIEYNLVNGAYRTPGGHPVRMWLREGTNDHNTLYASLNEDEYKLPRDRTGVAVDVGAYLGSVAIAYALDNPLARVIAIEPVPPNAELIRANIRENGLEDRISLIECAVGDGEPQSVWYGYRGNEAAEHHAFVGNSTLAYDHGGELAHEEVSYTSLTLRDVIELAGADIDWLKIDTEGAEWAFLASPHLRRVREFVGEWHPVRGHVQDDITDLLGHTHRVSFTGPVAGPGGFRAERGS